MTLEILKNPESHQPTRSRAALLLEEFERLESKYGLDAAMGWEVGLAQEDWLALMEARRTGLNAR